MGASGAALLSGPAGITDAATATPIITPTAAFSPPTELRQHRQPSAGLPLRHAVLAVAPKAPRPRVLGKNADSCGGEFGVGRGMFGERGKDQAQ
jgi:hypothetical protein